MTILFSALALKNITLKNRIVVSPMCQPIGKKSVKFVNQKYYNGTDHHKKSCIERP